MKKKSLCLCLFALLASCNGASSTSNTTSKPASTSTSDVTSSQASTSVSDATSSQSSTSTGDVTSSQTSTSTSTSSSSSSSSEVVDAKEVIAEKVELGIQNKGKVKSGKVTEKDLMVEDMEPSVYNYEFGESAFTYSGEGEFASTYVYFLDSNNEVFGIEDSGFGQLMKPYDLDPKNLEGYPFEGIISFEYEASYGAEDLVNDFFTEAKANKNKDAKFVVNETDYEFSFGIKADSESFVEVKVNFALSSNNALKTVDVQADTYLSDSFVDDIELGTVALKEDAVKEYSMSYSVVQVEGTRNYTSPYNENDFYFTSFDLSFDGASVTNETVVTVDKGSNASINIVNALPETASMNFDELSIEVTSGDAEGIYASSQPFDNSIGIMANEVGDYELTIQSKNVTKVVKVKVEEPSLQDFFIYKCKPNGVEGQYEYDLFDSNQAVYRTKSLVLMAMPDPYSADGSYEATLLNPIEGVTFNSVEIQNMMGEMVHAYEFTSAVVGTFNVKFTSTIDPTISKEVEINVSEMPNVSDIVKGEYVYRQYNGTEFEFEFTPDQTGLSGNVIIKDLFNNLQETLSYVINESNLDLTHVSGDTIIVETSSLKLNDQYQLVFTFMAEQFGDIYERELVLERKTSSVMIIGTYSAKVGELTYEISFNQDSAYMNYYNEDRSVEESTELEYTIADEVSGNGYAITWISKTNEEFAAIDVANTDSYLSADYQELHLTIVHDGNPQSVLFTTVVYE